MSKKLLAGLGIASALILPIALPITNVAAAQMSTTTLGTAIDSVNSTTYDYFTVLLAKYWPFVVGFIILLVVWHFGKRILAGFR